MSQRSGMVAAATAAFGSLATLACCLPLGMLGAAGVLGGAAIFFGAARPFLLAGSLALLAFAFVQVYRAPACDVRRSRVAIAILTVATLVVLMVLLFPQIIAGWLADWFPGE